MIQIKAQLLIAALISLASTFAIKAEATTTLPAECSTTLIQYRGNFQINNLDAQIRSAENYRKSVAAKRTKEDASNLNRINKVIAKLTTQFNAMNALQRDCMNMNPVYNQPEGGYGGEGGYMDGGYGGGEGSGSGGM